MNHPTLVSFNLNEGACFLHAIIYNSKEKKKHKFFSQRARFNKRNKHFYF